MTSFCTLASSHYALLQQVLLHTLTELTTHKGRGKNVPRIITRDITARGSLAFKSTSPIYNYMTRNEIHFKHRKFPRDPLLEITLCFSEFILVAIALAMGFIREEVRMLDHNQRHHS